jgi:hypothetical protein
MALHGFVCETTVTLEGIQHADGARAFGSTFKLCSLPAEPG